MKFLNRRTCTLFSVLTLAAAGLTLVGFFSRWVPEPAAGLALTGFEMAEWIKFAPEVREGTAAVRRADFYWPATVAALALLTLPAPHQTRRRWGYWLSLAGAVLVGLLPFPLLEEVQNMAGIRANWQRLLMVALPPLGAAILLIRPQLSRAVRGIVITVAAAGGLVLLTLTFSAAEPILERLLGHLIDPAPGYYLTRLGLLLLALAGVGLAAQRKDGAS